MHLKMSLDQHRPDDFGPRQLGSTDRDPATQEQRMTLMTTEPERPATPTRALGGGPGGAPRGGANMNKGAGKPKGSGSGLTRVGLGFGRRRPAPKARRHRDCGCCWSPWWCWSGCRGSSP